MLGIGEMLFMIIGGAVLCFTGVPLLFKGWVVTGISIMAIGSSAMITAFLLQLF